MTVDLLCPLSSGERLCVTDLGFPVQLSCTPNSLKSTALVQILEHACQVCFWPHICTGLWMAPDAPGHVTHRCLGLKVHPTGRAHPHTHSHLQTHVHPETHTCPTHAHTNHASSHPHPTLFQRLSTPSWELGGRWRPTLPLPCPQRSDIILLPAISSWAVGSPFG